MDRIEKSGFRRGEYVGYANGVWHIKKIPGGWIARHRDNTEYPSLSSRTLQGLNSKLAHFETIKKNPKRRTMTKKEKLQLLRYYLKEGFGATANAQLRLKIDALKKEIAAEKLLRNPKRRTRKIRTPRKVTRLTKKARAPKTIRKRKKIVRVRKNPARHRAMLTANGTHYYRHSTGSFVERKGDATVYKSTSAAASAMRSLANKLPSSVRFVKVIPA